VCVCVCARARLCVSICVCVCVRRARVREPVLFEVRTDNSNAAVADIDGASISVTSTACETAVVNHDFTVLLCSQHSSTSPAPLRLRKVNALEAEVCAQDPVLYHRPYVVAIDDRRALRAAHSDGQ